MDILALATMKNAAKCDTSCELQNAVNHYTFERKLRSRLRSRACLPQRQFSLVPWAELVLPKAWFEPLASLKNVSTVVLCPCLLSGTFVLHFDDMMSDPCVVGLVSKLIVSQPYYFLT